MNQREARIIALQQAAGIIDGTIGSGGGPPDNLSEKDAEKVLRELKKIVDALSMNAFMLRKYHSKPKRAEGQARP